MTFIKEMEQDQSMSAETKHSFLINMPKSKRCVIDVVHKLMDDP